MTYLLRATDKGEIIDRDGKVVGRVVPVMPTYEQYAKAVCIAHVWPMDDVNVPIEFIKIIRTYYRAMLSAATPDIAALAVEMPERYENVTNLGGFRAGFNTALDVLEGK